MIFDNGRNDRFYIVILIFIEKHVKMILICACAEIWTKQRRRHKSIEYDVQANLQHHNIWNKWYLALTFLLDQILRRVI